MQASIDSFGVVSLQNYASQSCIDGHWAFNQARCGSAQRDTAVLVTCIPGCYVNPLFLSDLCIEAIASLGNRKQTYLYNLNSQTDQKKNC